MFGSKKRKKAREQQAQQRADIRLEREKKYDAAIAKAAGIKDPAQKVIALRRVADEIDTQIRTEKSTIVIAAANRKSNTAGASSGASLVGISTAFGLSFAFPPAALAIAPVALIGSFGGSALAKKRSKSLKKQMEEEAHDHINRLDFLSAVAVGASNQAVKENVEKISQSPLKDRVLSYPGISEIFAEAAAKHIAAVKAEAAEKADLAAEEKKPAAPRKKQPPKYDELNGL